MTENQLLSLTRQYGSMDEALKNMPAAELRLNDNSVYDKKGTIESISGVIDRQTGTVVARVPSSPTSRACSIVGHRAMWCLPRIRTAL